MNDEDFFSDDATLDALDEGELRALEEEAVRSTQQHQHQQHQQQQRQQPQKLQHHNRPALAVLAPFKPHLPAYTKAQGYVSYSPQNAQETRQQLYEEEPTLPIAAAGVPDTYAANPEKPSSDYGDIEGFEETTELWDAPAPAVIGARGEAREYPVVNGGADIYDQEEQEWIKQQEELGQIMDDVVMGNSQHEDGGGDGLQANPANDAEKEMFRVRAAELQQLVEQYEMALMAKNGEVAILRDQKDQQRREWDRKISQLTNAHGEEKEKIKAECEVLRMARDQTQTELLFVMKERDDAVRRERAASRKIQHSTQEVLTQVPKDQELLMGGIASMQVGPPKNHGSLTPKRKDRGYAYRDGFEDDNVPISPSKRGAKLRTPTKTGVKRKRSVNGSPLPQLHLSQSRSTTVVGEPVPVIDDKVLNRLFSQDDRLEFFEAIILHRCPFTRERIFDALAKFSFPSCPQMTLSSYFLDKITALRTTAKNGAFSVGVSRVLLGMWSRCLQEGFFGALSLVVELFRFGILWTQGGHCFQVMDEALNLIQKTVDINAIPVVMKRDNGERTEGIPTIVCLQIMEDIALASIGEEVYIKRFWKQIRVDFPIICMHPGQPLDVSRSMASILCTSVMNDTFGPIISSNQRENEKFLLEAVTKPLELTPKMTSKGKEGEGKYTAMQVLELRQEILQFLGCVCSTESGMLAMARHDNAVSRVAIRVADEVDQCYEWRLGESARPDFINSAVRLLHSVTTSHPDEPNGKLSQHHKHLVSMTRIAFSEGMAQEAGLESGVIDCAFALLENMVTPDEAAALESMFNT